MVSADQLNSEGIRLSDAGKLDKALLAFTTALEMEPANPRVIYNMALVFIRKEDYATARELLEKAVSLDGDEADYRNDLGLCLYRSGLQGRSPGLLRPGSGAGPHPQRGLEQPGGILFSE